MRVAVRRELRVCVIHEPGLAGAEHDLEIRALDADVLEAVQDVRGAGDAVPLAQYRLGAPTLAVFEEDLDLALEDEKSFLDRMCVRGIALPGWHVHDGEREMIGGQRPHGLIAGGAIQQEKEKGAAPRLYE